MSTRLLDPPVMVSYSVFTALLTGMVKLFLYLLEHHPMKAWGSGGTAPRIFNLLTRWRWVVSFTPRLLYAQGQDPDTHWL